MYSLVFLLLLSPFFVEISTAGADYGKEIRQCTCAEQTECFGEMKEEVTKCFALSQEGTQTELKNLIYGLETEKLTPCFSSFKDFVLKFDDCIDAELAKEKSCVDYSGDQKVASVDFIALVLKELRGQVEKRMNLLLGLEKNPPWLRKWHDGAKECAFAKVLNVPCFAKKNCGVKTSEKQAKEAIKKCYKQLKVVTVQYNVCDCLRKNGIGQIEEYCNNVKHTQLPDFLKDEKESSVEEGKEE